MDFIWWLRGRFFITFFPVRSSIWLNNGNILTAATFLPQSRCHCSFEEELLSLRAYRGNFAQTAEDLSFQSHLKAFRTVAFHQLNWGNVARRYHCRLIQRWRSPFLSEKSVLKKISYIWLLSENQRTREPGSVLPYCTLCIQDWCHEIVMIGCRAVEHGLTFTFTFLSLFSSHCVSPTSPASFSPSSCFYRPSLTLSVSLPVSPVHSTPPGSRIQQGEDSSAVTTAWSRCPRQGQRVRTNELK